jgi:hypothetical protein
VLSPAEREALETGWLAGLVDGEGFIGIRFRKDRGTVFPRLRVYCTSKPIVEEAGRIMGVKPFPRRDHGVFKGWYVSVSHQKALRFIRRIAPYLKDPSKKCRAEKILKSFGVVATIHGSVPSDEFFKECPLPTRWRKRRKI